MKMSDGVEQAIHSVAMLSGLSESGVLSAAALAEFHGVSTSYLLKHLQALSGAGILDTVPGPKGGYRLAKAAEEISLLDILLAVEGPAPAFRCAEIRQRGPNPVSDRFFAKPCSGAMTASASPLPTIQLPGTCPIGPWCCRAEAIRPRYQAMDGYAQ